MNKDNKNTEFDNTDKKLHISDVMKSILSELNDKKDLYIKYNNDENSYTSLDNYYRYAADGIKEAIKIVEKYFS